MLPQYRHPSVKISAEQTHAESHHLGGFFFVGLVPVIDDGMIFFLIDADIQIACNVIPLFFVCHRITSKK